MNVEINKSDIEICDPYNNGNRIDRTKYNVIRLVDRLMDGSLWLCLKVTPEIIEGLIGKEVKEYFVARKKITRK